MSGANDGYGTHQLVLFPHKHASEHGSLPANALRDEWFLGSGSGGSDES